MATDAKSSSSAELKKEIYSYEAPFALYALSWSVRADKPFRMGMFVRGVARISLNTPRKARGEIAAAISCHSLPRCSVWRLSDAAPSLRRVRVCPAAPNQLSAPSARCTPTRWRSSRWTRSAEASPSNTPSTTPTRCVRLFRGGTVAPRDAGRRQNCEIGGAAGRQKVGEGACGAAGRVFTPPGRYC